MRRTRVGRSVSELSVAARVSNRVNTNECFSTYCIRNDRISNDRCTKYSRTNDRIIRRII